MHEVFFMIEDLKPLLKRFIVFAKDNLNFQRPPRLFLKQDTANQKCMLGKTAHYDPQNQAVTLYISGRHPKDILRSFAHELVHHCQNERGDLHPDKMKTMNQNYAQENDHMRKMEKEAYLQGNMCFRDWEDGLDDKLQYKMKLAEQKFLKENKTMSVKISKKELKNLIQKLLESKLEETDCGSREDKNKKRYMEESEDCKSCGGAGCVECNTIGENEELEELGEDLDKLKGGLKDYMKNKAGKTSGDAPASVDADDESSDSDGENDDGAGMTSPDAPMSVDASDDEKPDFPDVDGDGDRKEPISKAQKEKKKANESKIQTPEQENALYESRFTQRNTRLFEKLLKEWTK